MDLELSPHGFLPEEPDPEETRRSAPGNSPRAETGYVGIPSSMPLLEMELHADSCLRSGSWSSSSGEVAAGTGASLLLHGILLWLALTWTVLDPVAPRSLPYLSVQLIAPAGTGVSTGDASRGCPVEEPGRASALEPAAGGKDISVRTVETRFMAPPSPDGSRTPAEFLDEISPSTLDESPATPRPVEPSPRVSSIPAAKVSSRRQPRKKPETPAASVPTAGFSTSTSSQEACDLGPGEEKAPAAASGLADAVPGAGAGPALPGHISSGAGQGASGSFEVGQVDKIPEILDRVEPEYPFSARRKKITGRVTVRFLVDERGRVQSPSIVQASPTGIFEECVLKVIHRWRFTPGIYRGKPVRTWVTVPIQFRLTG